MTMGQYQRVLQRPGNWDALAWPLDRKTFLARIDELRTIRNDITHFNPDGVPEGTVEKLKGMLRTIREFTPSWP